MKMMYILLAIIFACTFLSAQNAVLRGKIINKESKKTLNGVEVFLSNSNIGAVSDSSGNFIISNLEAGKYELNLLYNGYQSISQSVNLKENQDLELSIIMQETILWSMEEIIIEAEHSALNAGIEVDVAKNNPVLPDDVGKYFRELPNTSAIKKGAFCCDPVIRGTTGEQLNLQVDNGIKVVGGCPNRMDPVTAHMQSEDLYKIEVFNGPYTVRFGPNMSGLVNMVMQKPDNFTNFEIHSSLESGYETISNGKKLRLSVNGGSKRINFYLNGGLKDFNNYKDAKGNEVPGNYYAQDYSLKTRYNFNENHHVQISVRESRHKDVSYPSLPMDAEFTNTHIYALDYMLRNVLPSVSSVHTKIYKADVEHRMSNLKRADRPMDGLSDSEIKNSGARLEAGLQIPFFDKLYLGGEYYHLNMKGLRTRTGRAGTMMEGRRFSEIIWPDADNQHYGFFMESNKSLLSNLFVSAGIRLDVDSYKGNEFDASFLNFYPDIKLNSDFSNLSFHINSEYRLTQGNSVSIKAGQGVRSPAVKELYINRFNIGRDGYEYLGNPQLEPEQNRQIDLSYSLTGNSLDYKTTLFYSSVRNYISAKYDSTINPIMMTVPGVKRFINIDKAYRIGGEILLDWRIIPALNISNTFAYTYGYNVTLDEPLMEIPPFEYKFSAKYNFDKGNNFVRVNGRIVAEQNRVSESFKETKTPGFNIWDVSAGYAIIKNISIVAGIENIFNQYYYEHLNRTLKYTDMKGQMFYEPGRNFYLFLKYHF